MPADPSSGEVANTSTSCALQRPMAFQILRRRLTTAAVPTVDGVSIANTPHWTNLLHSLCTAHPTPNPDAALRLLDRLRLRGFTPSPLTLSSILLSLCAARRHREAHHRLLLLSPSPVLSNPLLARLLDSRTPSLTLRLLAANPSFLPSLTNYNKMIHLFCSDTDHASANHLLHSMRQTPNAVSYTTLINGYSTVGDIASARSLFDEMLHRAIVPNSLTYSVLIKGILRKRRVDEAKELMGTLWSKMEDTSVNDVSVNNAAFANLIGALCREGLYHEVFRVAEEMPQGKCVGEEFAYGQMMDSFCRVGRHHMAARVVYIMRKRGFLPSLVSYNCIVHGLSLEGGCMRAHQLFREGVEFGYSPSEMTYKVLVEALCKEKDLCKAKDVAEFMLERDGIDRIRVYNIFLSALRLVENPSEQLNVVVSMLQKQCRPDVITLNTVIHGFCKIGKVDEAKQILDDMMKGKFCSPDVVTFTTIIRGLLDVRKPEEAINFFRKTMPKFSCPPNIVTYNAVVGGLCKCQRVDEAMEVFGEMVRNGVHADSITYTLIIDGLCEFDRLEEAKKFWDDVIWPSKVHDNYVYAAILRGLCRASKLDEACDFLYELVDCGVAPGIVNYNILIDNACKIGLKREAYQIVGEMRKNRLEPDPVTWRILEKFHEKEKASSNADSQISDPKFIAEESSKLIELTDGTSSTLHEEKERESDINRYANPLVGPIDPVLSSKLIEDPKFVAEDSSKLIELNDDTGSILHLEKECDNNLKRYADPLEGLVDSVISSKLMEEQEIDEDVRHKDGLVRDIIKENPLQPEDKVPLSRITRRVFGLL